MRRESPSFFGNRGAHSKKPILLEAVAPQKRLGVTAEHNKENELFCERGLFCDLISGK